MSQQLTRKERAEHLYRVITSERFLTKQGLGNEVPFFICPFPAEEGLTMIEDRLDLIERTGHAGVTALDLSLTIFRSGFWKSGAFLRMSSRRSLTWRSQSFVSFCKVSSMSRST